MFSFIKSEVVFAEGINDALFCSCFNYGSLVGAFTHPLLDVMTRSLEIWAAGTRAPESKPAVSLKSPRS